MISIRVGIHIVSRNVAGTSNIFSGMRNKASGVPNDVLVVSNNISGTSDDINSANSVLISHSLWR